MDPTIDILISSPVSGSEAAALRDIVAGLRAPSLVLVNFEVSSSAKSRQVDFLVVTAHRAELVELKCLTAPVRGRANGPWQLETSPGFFEPYYGPNPWAQVLDAKFALSDAMRRFAKQRPDIPGPSKTSYFEQVAASVTVYPQLMPGSQVWGGNFKAWVRSFPETLKALNSTPFEGPPGWEFSHWRAFATDHLGLRPATLAAAIDTTVFQANQLFEEYSARLRKDRIAPLLTSQENECTGEKVMDRLATTGDVLLVGRSGLGKSFHLDHYRRRCVRANEVPVLLYPAYYKRDLNRAIHKSIGRFTRLAPVELLEVTERLGMRPVVIADGWNDCPVGWQGNLSDDLAAFQLRYNARLVVASQTVPPFLPFAEINKVELAPLGAEHKQAIFAFYANQPIDSIPSQCYEPFSTAFDLSIAARSQRGSVIVETKAELYDAYTREVVPTATGRALLRGLAWVMGEEFKPVLALGEYERIAETLAETLGAPVTVVDELRSCRVLVAQDDVVTFEHDLLRDYFRAQHLARKTDPQHLSARLREPRYSALMEFIAPCITDQSVLQDLLATMGPEFLSLAFRGGLGTLPRKLVREQCCRLIAQCRESLCDVTLEASVGTKDDGGRYLASVWVSDSCCASVRDAQFCAVAAENLGDLDMRVDFLDLLRLGEWSLREASGRLARDLGFNPLGIWGNLLLQSSFRNDAQSVHPLLLICRLIQDNRSHWFGRSEPSPVRDALLHDVREGSAGMLALQILMADLRFCDRVDADDIIAVVRQAWDTKLSTIRMEALDFLRSKARNIRESGSAAETSVIDLLEEFDAGSNIFLSTQWLETRCCFDGFECGVGIDNALDELRGVLAMAGAGDDPLFSLELESNPAATFDQFIARRASSELGKMFEDVFQSVYYEAYQLLDESEKRRILTLALRNADFGSFDSLYLKWLIELGCGEADDVLIRYGGRIDTDVWIRQDCVDAFITATQAWARIAEAPMPYRDIDGEDHRAWAIVGEIVFWMSRPDPDASHTTRNVLLDALTCLPAALPDVLRQISNSHKGMGTAPILSQLLLLHPEPIKKALQESLRFEGRLTTVFRGGEFVKGETFRWLLSCLGDIGDRETAALLRQFSGSAIYGKKAIEAIEQIEKRAVPLHRQHPVGSAIRFPVCDREDRA